MSSKENTTAIDARKELIAAIDSLAKRGGITRDRAITAWYATTLLGIDEDEAIDAASVDGPEDGGCDFIYVDEEQETILVMQGYVSDRSERSASIKKWNSLVASITSIRDPIIFSHAGRQDIYERLTEIDINSFSIVLGLVTLAASSEQIFRQRESASRSKSYGHDVSFFYEYQDTIYDKYLIAKAANRNISSDTIQFGGAVADIKGDFGQAVFGSVSAKELARLHEKYGNQLFEGNVRLFMGQRKGGINEKISETALSRPGEFWALNNGITIVADGFEAITDSKYRVRQFSIVNGCQTTVSLAKAIERSKEAEEAQVLVRIVGAKKALLTDIVRYNNTQNPVRLSAVRLLDPIQESLRSSFNAIGYIYAPKQEGTRTVKNLKRIELDRIAQYLAAMDDDTVLDAVVKKSDLFDRSYKTIFPRGIRPERVFLAWLLAQEIESERSALREAIDGDADQITKIILGIHGTPWGLYVSHLLIGKLGSDLSRLNLEKMNTPEFRNAVSKYAKKAMELYSEIAINIVSHEEGSNIRNEIRVKSFQDRLKKTLSLRMAKANTWKLPKLHSVAQ